MGDTLAKAVLFQAPSGPFSSAHIVWDERPAGTPEGGVKRPFLLLERPGTTTTLIYFHGNAEDLMDVEGDLEELSAELWVNVLAVEYPGYGLLRAKDVERRDHSTSFSLCTRVVEQSGQTGTTVDGIDRAAAHALAYVITTRGVPGSQVILFGRSLGSGVALRLAHNARERYHWNVGAVILQCPYISIRQIVSDYACSVGSLLIPSYYDNLSTLRLLFSDCPEAMDGPLKWVPLLILHGEQDEIIWSYHGRTLYEEALKLGHPAVDALFPPGATHNRWDLQEEIIAPIRAFMRKHMVRSVRSDHPGVGCFGPAPRTTGRAALLQANAGDVPSCSNSSNAFAPCIGFGSGANLLERLLAPKPSGQRRLI